MLGSSFNCEIIASPTGKIIIEVAVLEIHIDKKAVANMKPSITRDLLLPVILIIFKASLLCKRHFSIASAIMNPPTKRKTNLWPYAAVVVARSRPPVSGKRTMGNKAVTEIGTHSVTHQTAIHTVEANMHLASILSPSASKNNNINEKKNGPRINPIIFLDNFI